MMPTPPDVPTNAASIEHVRAMLTAEQVLARIPISRTTLFRLERDGFFPRGQPISPHRKLWFEDEVVAWQRPTTRPRVHALDRNAFEGEECEAEAERRRGPCFATGQAMTIDQAHRIEDVRRMLTLQQVLEIVPVSRMTLFRMERDGRFPPSYYVSGNRKAWFADEVAAWQSRMRPARVGEAIDLTTREP
jgi:predicted DNA-binding transcriptional regulator AlpA